MRRGMSAPCLVSNHGNTQKQTAWPSSASPSPDVCAFERTRSEGTPPRSKRDFRDPQVNANLVAIPYDSALNLIGSATFDEVAFPPCIAGLKRHFEIASIAG